MRPSVHYNICNSPSQHFASMWMPCLRHLFAVMSLSMISTIALAASGTPTCPPLLEHAFAPLQEADKKAPATRLCQYAGKVILVVNTASYCGYTDQYAGLEALYRQYKDQGLVVLGFPSNDFGGQEPGSNTQIAQFCRLTYKVDFPMVAKSKVSGPKRNAFYAELARRTGDVPQWNFHKYLIDRTGKQVKSFASAVDPKDPRLVKQMQQWLAAR